LENYVARDKLRDGRDVTVRALHPEDRHNLEEIWHHLSPRSIYFRFFVPKKELTDKELNFFTKVDFDRHVALLAFLTENGVEVPVGVGRYVVISESEKPKVAEVALTVEDEYQGLGIGTVLLRHLIDIARAAGVSELSAFVLSENKNMLEVFEHSGLPMERHLADTGIVEIRLRLPG
ncbi:MAG TPA: GNAT family N-acetyltransferase, partial [Candidatus Obscuribacterales bacterium]